MPQSWSQSIYITGKDWTEVLWLLLRIIFSGVDTGTDTECWFWHPCRLICWLYFTFGAVGESWAGRTKEERSWWNCCWGYFSGVDTGAYIDADIHVDSHTDRREPAETVIIAEETADAWRLDALSLKIILKNFNFNFFFMWDAWCLRNLRKLKMFLGPFN